MLKLKTYALQKTFLIVQKGKPQTSSLEDL